MLLSNVKVLHSVCCLIWKTQQWPQDRKRSVFIPIPKKSNAKEYSNYHTTVLISYASKVVLKILQVSSKFFNCLWTENFQIFKLDLEKAEKPEQIANIRWIIKKAREFQKNIYFCFIDHVKAFNCVDHNKLWKFFKRWEY